MSGWSTPDPVAPTDGGLVDWLNERKARENRFHLAYSRAQIDYVVSHKLRDHDDVGALLDLPSRDLTELLRGLDATLLLKLHPWSSLEVVVDREREGAGAPAEEFYVPSGHRLLETLFAEFVGGRYIDQLLCHLDAYVELYTFGVRPQDSEEIAWEISDASRQVWSEHLRRCYSRLPWRKEAWVDHELSSRGLEQLRLYESERLNIDPSQYQEFVRRVVDEDRHWPTASRPLRPCAELLASGPLGFWEKHRRALLSEFRTAFVDGRRVASTIDDAGRLEEVSRDWWRGDQCTRLLLALDFRHPDGVLLEHVQPAEVHAPLEERISLSLQGMAHDGERSPVDREVDLAVAALEAMLGAGELASRDTWHRPHLTKMLVDVYYKRHPDPSCRKWNRPSDKAIERACGIFWDLHPELRPSKKGGRGPGN